MKTFLDKPEDMAHCLSFHALLKNFGKMKSFDFTWSNEDRPTGKVFARKRAAGSKSSKSAEPNPVKFSKPETTVVYKKPEAGVSGQLIKRKQRKDKRLAKTKHLQNEEDADVSSPEITNKPSHVTHSLFSVRHEDVYVNADIKGKSVVEKVFSAEKKFADLEIHRHLVANLEKNSFTTLTKVQEKSIPVLTAGKNALRSDGAQALIVVPTRELALQTHELFGKINTFQWVVVGHLCGGENRKTEKDRLRKGVHVLIGTPGRLLDHILHTSALKTNNVRCLVLDEADRLLDMGFKRDIVRIVEELDRAKTNAEYDPLSMLKGQKPRPEETDEGAPPLKSPRSKARQTVLLSATLGKGIAELADFTMKDHVYVDALDDSPGINPGHMVIPDTVKQEFVITYAKHKLFTLSAMLLAKARHKVFVFMATTQMVDYHYDLFTKYLANMPKNRGKLKTGEVAVLENSDFADSGDEEEVVFEGEFFKLHGNMSQEARKEVFTAFRAAKRGILI
ncbi:ATP-dependent RNA helicase -like, partial [Asbolus verrucosus]